MRFFAVRQRDRVFEPRHLAGLGNLPLQLEPELLDVVDRRQFVSTRHLVAEGDEECATIGVLHVGQRSGETALRVAGDRLQDAEQFLQRAEPLIERRAGGNDLRLLVLEQLLEPLTLPLLAVALGPGLVQKVLLLVLAPCELCFTLTSFL